MKNAYSANSVTAAARSMFGKRLLPKDYDALLSCKSVSEVADCLKNQTAYSAVLKTAPTSKMHRGQVEDALRRHVLGQFETLMKFELAAGGSFYNFFILKKDIEQLLLCISLLNTGRAGEYLLSMPAFYDECTDIDLFRLQNASSFDDIVECLRSTRYEKLLAPCAAEFARTESPLGAEAALNRYYYEELAALAAKNYRGAERDGLVSLIRMSADTDFLVWALRLKKLVGADASRLRSFFVPGVTELSEREVSDIVSAESWEALRKSISATRYEELLRPGEYPYPEVAAAALRFERAKNRLRFSQCPGEVLYCFLFLAENEINNIIHIVEGVRYGVSENEIRSILVGTEK